jgi:hypothetical protein
LYLGNVQNSVGFRGSIDEVNIWTRALTDSEISSDVMNNVIIGNDLAARYKLSNLLDSSVNQRTLTASNSPVISIVAPICLAAETGKCVAGTSLNSYYKFDQTGSTVQYWESDPATSTSTIDQYGITGDHR